MPLSIVASFMSIGNMEGGVPEDVRAAIPRGFDPDIDFWAFGVMILEHYCKIYCLNRFRVRYLGESSLSSVILAPKSRRSPAPTILVASAG